MPGFQRMATEVPWKSMEFFAVAEHGAKKIAIEEGKY